MKLFKSFNKIKNEYVYSRIYYILEYTKYPKKFIDYHSYKGMHLLKIKPIEFFLCNSNSMGYYDALDIDENSIKDFKYAYNSLNQVKIEYDVEIKGKIITIRIYTDINKIFSLTPPMKNIMKVDLIPNDIFDSHLLIENIFIDGKLEQSYYSRPEVAFKINAFEYLRDDVKYKYKDCIVIERNLYKNRIKKIQFLSPKYYHATDKRWTYDIRKPSTNKIKYFDLCYSQIDKLKFKYE